MTEGHGRRAITKGSTLEAARRAVEHAQKTHASERSSGTFARILRLYGGNREPGRQTSLSKLSSVAAGCNFAEQFDSSSTDCSFSCRNQAAAQVSPALIPLAMTPKNIIPRVNVISEEAENILEQEAKTHEPDRNLYSQNVLNQGARESEAATNLNGTLAVDSFDRSDYEIATGTSECSTAIESNYSTGVLIVDDEVSTHAATSLKSEDSGLSKAKVKGRPVYDVVIKNLTYKVNTRGKKDEATNSVLLNGINAQARNSEILAIIGPSGSSKTTLLDALAGRINSKSLEGLILVNGMRVDDGMKAISGYVMQDDALFPMLTAKEILMFMAQLRLSKKITIDQKRDRVKALIDELGLTSCCNTRVGNDKIRGISGGERRRLSIGVDMIHDPPVLLLDEPTSGLDSTSALQVMETLRRLAVKRMHTVVLTVHQPSHRILLTIHNTLILASGNVVYHGPPSGIFSHFNSLRPEILAMTKNSAQVNVVEYALDTVADLASTPEGFQKLLARAQEMEKSTEMEKIPEEKKIGHKRLLFSRRKHKHTKFSTSLLSELMVLSERNFYNIFRTHTLFLTRVGVTALTSLMMVSLFFHSPISERGLQNRQVFVVFTIAILVFTSTEALPIFLLERQIFIRETSRGAYRASSYVLAHTLVVLPFLMLLSVLCMGVSYFAVGLVGSSSAVLTFTSVIFLVLCMSNALVMMISALAPSYTVGLALVGGLAAYMFLFSGFFMNRERIPFYWLWMHYGSLFKYSYESLMANEFQHRPGAVWYQGITSEEAEINLLGGNINQTMNILMMLAFVIVYRFIFYLALRFGTKSVRN